MWDIIQGNQNIEKLCHFKGCHVTQKYAIFRIFEYWAPNIRYSIMNTRFFFLQIHSKFMFSRLVWNKYFQYPYNHIQSEYENIRYLYSEMTTTLIGATCKMGFWLFLWYFSGV